MRRKARISPEADGKLKSLRKFIADYRRQVDALQGSKHHACCACGSLASEYMEGIEFIVDSLLESGN